MPACPCECFQPGKLQLRQCQTCKHGWVPHGKSHPSNGNFLGLLSVVVLFHPSIHPRHSGIFILKIETKERGGEYIYKSWWYHTKIASPGLYTHESSSPCGAVTEWAGFGCWGFRVTNGRVSPRRRASATEFFSLLYFLMFGVSQTHTRSDTQHEKGAIAKDQ